MALAHPRSLHSVWYFARRLVMVCRTPPLRKCRRLYRSNALLFFTGGNSQLHTMGGRAGYRWSVGNVWRSLHSHRGGAHALCSALSGVVELAPDIASSRIADFGCWIAIRVGDRHSGIAGVYVVSRARSQTRCGGNSRVGLFDCGAAAICLLFFSSRAFSTRPETLWFPGCELARDVNAGRLQAIAERDRRQRPGTATAVSGGAGHISGVAANSLLRECGTAAYGGGVSSAASAFAPCGGVGFQPHRRSLRLRIRLRDCQRPARNQIPRISQRCSGRTGGGQRALGSGWTITDWPLRGP